MSFYLNEKDFFFKYKNTFVIANQPVIIFPTENQALTVAFV